MSLEFRIFSVILLSTLLIFSFSHFGAKAFEGMINNTNEFSENTIIGTVDISNLENTEASQKLAEKVVEWQTNTSIQLTYQQLNTSIQLDVISFMIDESLRSAKDSFSNELLVQLDDLSLQAALSSISPTLSSEKVDFIQLKEDILLKARTLEKGTFKIEIESYLLKPVMKEQIIQTISLPTETMELNNIGATLIIEPKSTFSLLNYLEKQGFTELESSSIDLLASGVYQTILPTNFQVIERHISSELPENIELGYEAKVNSESKWDLSFYNPNEEAYKIEIYSDGKAMIFDLVGVPFLYQYEVKENGIQEILPKIIKQYSPLLAAGSSKITRKGQTGQYIELYRFIKDETGNVIEQELLSKDYYSPIHQIEVFALKTNDIVNPDVTTLPEGIPGESVIVPSNGTDLQENQETTDEKVESDETTSEDPLWGKPNENEK